MNKKAVTLAIAAALVAPISSVYADVKLSGAVQAEMGAATIGQVNGEEADTIRVSKDGSGALLNGGANKVRIDVDEKLGEGLTAYGRYQFTFNTATNSGSSLTGQEAWVGLKTESFFVRFGSLEGAYKSSKGLVDPFAGTAIQARGTAGGMSGSGRLDVSVTPNENGKFVMTDRNTGETYRADVKTVSAKTNHQGLAHSGEVQNALELGTKFDGFSASFQGVFDETDNLEGGGIIELKYAGPNFTVFAAGSYMDFGDATSTVTNTLSGDDDEDNKGSNWKVGGQFQMAGVTLGLQYEDAELGAFDPNPDGGRYILGSVDYKLNNVAVGGWVAQYLSDIDDASRWIIDAEAVDEDALNWAVGFKYFFSKRTMFYGGYLQTDSDNDYRDQQAYGVGVLHSF